MNQHLVEILEWDTQFFGFPVGRITEPHLDPNQIKLIRDECRTSGIQVLYWLASPQCKDLGVIAADAGFRFMDFRIELEMRIGEDPHLPISTQNIRPYELRDRKFLINIAKSVHTDSRFFLDPTLRSKSPLLFERWIDRDVSREHGIVLVADTGQGACGYCTCHRNPDQNEVGIISLVGVHPQAAGKGLGHMMISSVLRWFSQNGCKTASVVTQGSNIAAQRLYQRAGFQTRSTGVWFHMAL